MAHVVVVGAGIVGVSTALWLRRSGHQVTLIDRGAPGQGTSLGNAGLLASWAVIPVTVPGLTKKAPGYLIDRDFPLYLRWSYLPRLLPWLRRFLAHANDADTRRISAALTQILPDSVEQHRALAAGGRAEKYIVPGDFVFAYRDRTGFDADHYAWDLRREAGFAPEVIEGRAVTDYDPGFGPDIGCLARLGGMAHIRDPGMYVAALAEDFQAEGGQMRFTTLQDVVMGPSGVTAAICEGEEIACDRLVLCAGIWSKPLMAKLKLAAPLESERGYHVVFKNATGGPRMPAMITTGKFGATPMDAGLRCAGTVELGGIRAGPSRAPLALLRREARRAFPALEWDGEEEWLGHRPSTPDSLPMIGETAARGVYAAFGHQHVGITSGPKTGRIIAAMIDGDRPNIDLAPFDPGRFNRS